MRKPKPKQSETDAFIADWEMTEEKGNGLIQMIPRKPEGKQGVEGQTGWHRESGHKAAQRAGGNRSREDKG